MKKFVLAALAATTIFGGTTAAMAQPFDGHRGNNRAVVTKQVYRDGPNRVVTRDVRRAPEQRWNKGGRFDYRQVRYSRINDYRRYHFRAPPRGYQWVRQGNDALLVGITTGVIMSVLANQF